MVGQRSVFQDRALSHPVLFGGRFGSPTKIDYTDKRNGTLILTSLLEHLPSFSGSPQRWRIDSLLVLSRE